MDEWTGALHRDRTISFRAGRPADADGDRRGQAGQDESTSFGHARRLRITEEAIAGVQAAIAPGVRQTDLTARFLHTGFEPGPTPTSSTRSGRSCPPAGTDGPWTTHGDLACPLLSTERELAEGDVIWVDTGISYAGFASDFGRTWVVGREPQLASRRSSMPVAAIIDAVLDVTRAGATAADLTAAAIAPPAASNRGCRTSISATGWASRAPNRLHRAPTSATHTTPRCPGRRHRPGARADGVGRRCRRLPRRGGPAHHGERMEPMTDYPYDPF